MSASYSFCVGNLIFISSFDDNFPSGIHIDTASVLVKIRSNRRQRGRVVRALDLKSGDSGVQVPL